MLKNNPLPKDGSSVVAMTFASIEYDRPPQEVKGILKTRRSPFGGLPQCWVSGIQVDPRTVKEMRTDHGST